MKHGISSHLRPSRRLIPLVVGLAGLVSIGAVNSLAVGTPSAPTSFALVFEGSHVPGSGPTGFVHEGAFSAVSPACDEGLAADVQYVHPDSMLREFRCADGSGSFVALVGSIFGEHGGPGDWKIVGGTGAYRKLRGRGAFETELTGGHPSDESSVGFRSTWTGMVGFDDVAPTIRITGASAAKLRRPKGTYVLRIAFAVRDDVAANAVEYRVLPTSERPTLGLGFREGRTSSHDVSLSLRVQPPTGTRKIVLEIRAMDPVGNERRIVRALTLPA